MGVYNELSPIGESCLDFAKVLVLWLTVEDLPRRQGGRYLEFFEGFLSFVSEDLE